MQIVLFVAVGLVTARVSEDARRLHHLAATDDLTGLHNLRSFEARLVNLVRHAESAGSPLAMLVLDLDRLKSINDVYGHLAGAEAVRTVGGVLASRLPPDAVACRYGGDEFAVALPGHTVEQALQVAGELRQSVAAAAPLLAGISFRQGTLSISVGVACLERQPRRRPGIAFLATSPQTSGEVLFKAADDGCITPSATDGIGDGCRREVGVNDRRACALFGLQRDGGIDPGRPCGRDRAGRRRRRRRGARPPAAYVSGSSGETS